MITTEITPGTCAEIREKMSNLTTYFVSANHLYKKLLFTEFNSPGTIVHFVLLRLSDRQHKATLDAHL